MDFELTEDQKGFRKELDDFVRQLLPPEWDETAIYWPAGYGSIPIAEAEFRDVMTELNRKLGEKGWLIAGWPKEYGGMSSMTMQAIVDEVTSYYLAPAGGIATMIAGPTLIAVGSEEMKKTWLPKIASGEATFWLGYSEPNAGSDLGAIKTTAIADGDDFVVNGQKIWSSAAHVSDHAWLLARTDLEASKHKGATLFIVDNNSPGITIRPIENICRIHSFNEVFFDNVRVPKDNVVGQLHRGFYNVMLALQFERLLVGAGAFRRVLEDLIQYARETLVDGRPLSKNPLVRNKLASMAIEIETLYGFYWRTAWLMDQGKIPELEASVLKLFATELSRKLAGTGMEILGPYGQLEKGSDWAPLRGRISLGYLDSISGPIGAGTSEIQRSIIATRGLGLPRK
jgi:alkylation response protein AidB-like acyl-CoA dehydrogenase